MKLDQRHNKQSKSDRQTQGSGEILRKKKSAETKDPRAQHHDLKLARGMCFQNLERHQDHHKRDAGLDSFDRAVGEKDSDEDYRAEK